MEDEAGSVQTETDFIKCKEAIKKSRVNVARVYSLEEMKAGQRWDAGVVRARAEHATRAVVLEG